ncbi:MAG: PAC2 family protein [Ilumatobacteraceae bacterium]
MEHVRWLPGADAITLNNPVVVAAFTGWNDAGDAASTAVRTMVETSGAVALAEIDPEPFTDFATVRPHVRLDDDRNRSIVWPTVGVWGATTPAPTSSSCSAPNRPCGGGRSVSRSCRSPIASAPGWRSRSAHCSPTCRTRRTQVIGTATDPDLIDRFDLERSRYEGPTGIVGVLHEALSENGFPTASLWAAVPGYAAQLPSPRATFALLDKACSMMGTPAPVAGVAAEIADYDAKVAALISDDDDLVTYVARLEEMVDEMADDDEDDELLFETIDDTDPGLLVDEVEQFLRNQDD